MAVVRNWFSLHWPVVAIAALTAAIAVGAQLGNPNFTFAMPAKDYPLRLVLPRAEPLEAGRVEVPPSTGMAVHYAPDADPFAGDSALAAAPRVNGQPADGVRPSIDLSGGLARPVELEGAGTPIPVATRSGGLLAVDFDLSDPLDEASVASGSAIEIRKKVKLNGKDAGSADLRVGNGSTIAMSREALSRLLNQSGRQELARELGEGTGSYVTFEEMRRQGIDVRYDPASDVILVAG